MRRFAALGLVLAASALGILAVGGCPGSGGTAGGFNVAPNPIITADLTRGVAPLTVQFSSDRSTDDGLIVERVWDFGDGSPTSQEVSPRHIYRSTGVFTVRLTLRDDVGLTASRTQDITITEAPVPIIVTDKTVAESAPALISFDASNSFDPDGEITQFQWDFGDGSREFITAVAHQYSSPGTYRARLTVTDDTGITASSDVLIQVGLPPPNITLRVPPDNSLRAENDQITNLVVSPESPLWVQAITSVDDDASTFTSAGLDGDSDRCQAQSVIIDLTSGSLSGRAFDRDASRVAAGVDAPAVYFQDQIVDAAYSPDGATVLTGSANARIRRHRVSDRLVLSEFAAASSISALAVSPAGTEVAYGQNNGLVVIKDVASGATIREFTGHTGGVNELNYSPDGSQILTGANDRRAILWRVNDGTILRDFEHPLAVNGVAFNPADPTIIATACEDAIVRVFNVTGGNTVVSITGHGDAVNDVIFSRDGTVLYSGGDDNVTRSWNPATGAVVKTFTDPAADITCLAISTDGTTLVTGCSNGFVRIWNVTTAALSRSISICTSAISSVQISPDGRSVLAAIASKNALALDRIDGQQQNGNDLNLSIPVPLGLQRVPAFGGRFDVPPGNYSLFTQVQTNEPDALRPGENVTTRLYYPNLNVQVVAELTSTVDPLTPIATLVNDRATIIPPALPIQCTAPGNTCCTAESSNCRQIVDIGAMNRGDRIFLSLMSTPGFGRTFESVNPYSVMLLDSDSRIFAWYEQRNTTIETVLGTSVVKDQFQLFAPSTRLIVGHNTARTFLVLDGSAGVDIRVQRNTGQFQTRAQRVRVVFSGTANNAVAVRDVPATLIPRFDASIYNDAFTPAETWGETETAIIRNAILATLQSKFAGFNIEFIPQLELTDPAPALPFVTLYIGGEQTARNPNTGLFESVLGEGDYVDPRNDSDSGVGVVYASFAGRAGIVNPFGWQNPVSNEADMGALLGTIAAQQVGKLLGLRLVEGNAADIMGFTRGGQGNDPTISLSFSISTPRADEQALPGLPGIGLQDAPLNLAETLGGN